MEERGSTVSEESPRDGLRVWTRASAFVVLILVSALFCVSGVSAQEGIETGTDSETVELDAGIEFEDTVIEGEETTVSPVVTVEEIPFSVDVSVEMTMYVDGEATETVGFEETVSEGTVVRREFAHTFGSPGERNVEFEGVFSALGQEMTRTVSEKVTVVSEDDERGDREEGDGGSDNGDVGNGDDGDGEREDEEGDETGDVETDGGANAGETNEDVGETDSDDGETDGEENEGRVTDSDDGETDEGDGGSDESEEKTVDEPGGEERHGEGERDDEEEVTGKDEKDDEERTTREETETEDDTPDGDANDDVTGTEDGGTDEAENVPMPGFTALVAVVAVLTAYFFVRRV